MGDYQMRDKKYLERLSIQFPTAADAATEIINLSSALNLPKGTEHFITDIHGEYEPFLHILKNGSGSIRKKIEEEFKGSRSVRIAALRIHVVSRMIVGDYPVKKAVEFFCFHRRYLIKY